MRRYCLLSLDVFIVCFATLLSFGLRENFEISADRALSFIPYLIATLLASPIVFSTMGLDRMVWRFSGRPDYIRVILASFAFVAIAVALTFAYDRLDGVARSLPILQFLACILFLIGARALHKIGHDIQRHRQASPVLLRPSYGSGQLNILIVGISRFTKVYLRAIDEFAPGRVRIAGLLGHSARHVGRLVASHPVIGTPSEIEQILNSLDVHGVSIDQIVITSDFHSLPEADRDALLRAERARGVVLRCLADDFGLLGVPFAHKTQAREIDMMAPELSFQIESSELERIAKRRYWLFKRIIDCAGASFLLMATAPFMAITALFVALNIGLPVLFWQQRPGLGGKPFQLYKFRSMRAGHAPDGRRLTDAERVSRVGILMRRLRLDELPQLFNILRGDMCFIGPRPLLPCDQSDAHRARLLVRPGLTGWAQVIGGRDISPEDKAALDIWYVRNASLSLDLQIFARTAFMVLFGERISRPLIEMAWRELSNAGILRGEVAARINNNSQLNAFSVQEASI